MKYLFIILSALFLLTGCFGGLESFSGASGEEGTRVNPNQLLIKNIRINGQQQSGEFLIDRGSKFQLN